MENWLMDVIIRFLFYWASVSFCDPVMYNISSSPKLLGGI